MDIKIEDIESGTIHTFAREDRTLGYRRCTIQVDDPGLDGTGYEHPAYLRGQDSTIDNIVKALNKILDGTFKKGGVFGHPGLQRLKERLIAMSPLGDTCPGCERKFAPRCECYRPKEE